MVDINRIMADLSVLHDDIHRNDPGPQTEIEAQAAVVLDGFKRTLLSLILEECSPETIELSLFYFWHLTLTRNAGLEREAKTMQLDQALPVAARLMRDIAATLSDDGPSAEMMSLGDMVTLLKQAFHYVNKKPRNRQQIVVETEKANSAIAMSINSLLEHGIHPTLIQNVMLYYWLRISTINANVEEALFQKIERNWPDAVEAFNPGYLEFVKFAR